MPIECCLCHNRKCLQENGLKITKDSKKNPSAIEIDNTFINKEPRIITNYYGKTTTIEVNGLGISGCMIRKQIINNGISNT